MKDLVIEGYHWSSQELSLKDIDFNRQIDIRGIPGIPISLNRENAFCDRPYGFYIKAQGISFDLKDHLDRELYQARLQEVYAPYYLSSDLVMPQDLNFQLWKKFILDHQLQIILAGNCPIVCNINAVKEFRKI
jgi:hypothetical protein